jgi:hypothetical protein
VQLPPVKLWQDSGAMSGGRPGSMWAIGNLQLLAVVEGHEPPKGPFWELVQAEQASQEAVA